MGNVAPAAAGDAAPRQIELWFYGPGYIGGQTSINIAPNGELWCANGGSVAVYGPDGVFRRVETKYVVQDGIVWVDGDVVGCMFQAGVKRYHGDAGQAYDVGVSGYGPRDITLDDKGFAYVTDGGNHSVKKLDLHATASALVQEFKPVGDPPIQTPYSAAVDSTGRVFVSDEKQPGIWIYKPDGSFETRLFPDQTAFKIRRGPAGMYCLTTKGMLIFNPTDGSVVKQWASLPPGVVGDAGYRGFAVDPQGNFYIGQQYHQIYKYSPEGTLLQTISCSYYASMTVPDACTQGQMVSAPLTCETRTDKPVGKIPPTYSMTLAPAVLRQEADLGARSAGEAPKEDAGQFDSQQQKRLDAQAMTLRVVQQDKSLQYTIPADLPPDLYRLKIHADDGTPDGQNDREVMIRVVAPGTAASLTLFSPRLRAVFQQGETAEIDAILRSKQPLPTGALRFTLVSRQGDSLTFQTGAPVWKSFSVPGVKQATLTFNLSARAIQAGRYLLQAEYSAGGLTLRDTWPLEIVDTVRATRFNILLPEWGAGYTNLIGPFTGRGMQADAATLGREGLTLVDVDITNKAENAPVAMDRGQQQQTQTLMDLAAADPGLPAPEKFVPPSYLEVELQEALRNHYSVQRAIWGGWSMMDWAYGLPLTIARDNRHSQLWTQWQREWPSWIGHRFLDLSSTDQNDQEARGVQASHGLNIPTSAEVAWAYNGQQHHLVTGSPTGSVGWWSGGGSDAAGNIYVAQNGSVLSYGPDGAFKSKAQSWALNDTCVGPDGTVYGAGIEGGVSVTTPDGKMTSFHCKDFSSHSPRGICLDPDGNILATDQADDGSGRQKIVRSTKDGKLLQVVADKRQLKSPEGVTCLKDGTIVVADPGRGGLVFLKPDGTEARFISVPGIGTTGGKAPVLAAPDGSIWVARGQWGYVDHIDSDGKSLGTIGRHTLALGATGYPTGLGFTRDGDILVGDIGTAWVTEFRPDGKPTGRVFGVGDLVVDVRVDRKRYTWKDKMIATVFAPIKELAGSATNTLHAFLTTGKELTDWQPLPVTPYTTGEFTIPAPKINGDATLRLVWDKDGTPDSPQHADFTITVNEVTPAADQRKMDDIVTREVSWKETWSRTRMGALDRWTDLSNKIRPGTESTAPGNYGGWESVSGGVWPPYRTRALVAEAENEGHDYGTFPLMGAFNVARSTAGAHPLPAWSSLLEWYWSKPYHFQRPIRDLVVDLGAGASGIGVGKPVTCMDDAQLAVQRKVIDQLHRVGDACAQLDPPGQGGVAVLHAISEEALAPDWFQEQYYSVHAAWYDLLRAHIPTAVVNEETIDLNGGRDVASRFRAILLPDLRFPLPAATMAALANYQKLGGEVWVDLGCRVDVPGAKLLKTYYWPFWVQETYFAFVDYGGLGYDGNYEYYRMRQGSDYRLPAIHAAFDRFASMPVNTIDPNVYLQQRTGGTVKYVFASSTHYPDKPLIESSITYEEPVPATVSFNTRGGAVYDVFAMKRVTGQALSVDFTSEAPARIWAVLPRPIANVTLKAVLEGDRIFARAAVLDTGGKPVAGVVPLEFTVTAPTGQETHHLWRSTDTSGSARIAIPVEWKAPTGTWTITVRELLSGKEAPAPKVRVGVQPPAPITEVTAPALVFDQPAISAWLKANRGKEVWIPLGKDQAAELQSVADDLARHLVGRGVNARVIHIEDIPVVRMRLTYGDLTDQEKTDIHKVLNGEAVGTRAPDDYSVASGPATAICRPMILLGQPAQNKWLADIDSLRLYRRPILPDYPGPGRSLVQYVWAPFYDGFDVVCITANDLDGLKSGIAAFVGM